MVNFIVFVTLLLSIVADTVLLTEPNDGSSVSEQHREQDEDERAVHGRRRHSLSAVSSSSSSAFMSTRTYRKVRDSARESLYGQFRQTALSKLRASVLPHQLQHQPMQAQQHCCPCYACCDATGSSGLSGNEKRTAGLRYTLPYNESAQPHSSSASAHATGRHSVHT